jgi:hypothetical protein
MGVLITGHSGVGKSELALELISRGHGLVADDVVEMARIAPTTIEGRCPGMLRDFLEVRGLGLLNIRTIFGETASRRKMKLKLIVHLQKTLPRMTLRACRSMRRRRKCSGCRSARWLFQWLPDAIWLFCSKLLFATPFFSYAVSTACRISWIGSSA